MSCVRTCEFFQEIRESWVAKEANSCVLADRVPIDAADGRPHTRRAEGPEVSERIELGLEPARGLEPRTC